MQSSLLQHAVPVGASTAAVIAWQFKGEIRVTAIVKATYAFAHDAVMTRVEPQPIFATDVQHGRNPTRSVRFTTDLVPYRKRADVLFTGYAHAPAGARVESMNVRLAISDGARTLLDKSLVVRKKGGFDRIALDYEHAYGGIGFADNPYGEGFEEDEEPEDLNVFDPADPRGVASFAPLSRNMPPRRPLLGLLPLPSFGPELVQVPETLNFDFFQAAPVDQRIDFLRGDEWLLLEGLHPTRPSTRMRLPGARGAARIHGLADLGIPEGRPLAMYADTLHVSGDEGLCTVTWRGTFAVSSPAVPSEAMLPWPSDTVPRLPSPATSNQRSERGCQSMASGV